MSELKAGDSLDFTVADKTLTVEPIPYGNLKKILRIVFSMNGEIKSGGLANIADLFDRYLTQILPLLFRKDRYPFLTTEWVEENVTLPTLRAIFDTAVVVNGLKDFFGKGAAASVVVAPLPLTDQTPRENSGSTTSSGSPTAGVSPTSTV